MLISPHTPCCNVIQYWLALSGWDGTAIALTHLVPWLDIESLVLYLLAVVNFHSEGFEMLGGGV